MQVELRKESDCWSVFVDGIRCVDRESFTIADRIAEHLRRPTIVCGGECAEVARSIRSWYEQRGV
jgi:hypothetical protein